MTRIGLIGDHDESVTAHRAIPLALDLAATALNEALETEWIATDSIDSTNRLTEFDGLWCVPASPYKSMKGALRAIRYARENARPFLGTCGGFQHAVVEYARNVLGLAEAEHAETAPDASLLAITPLRCALVDATDPVRFSAGSRLQRAYRSDRSVEGYRCSYGLSPNLAQTLMDGPLQITAIDPQGDVRALELQGHPFYVLTLFQPERAALQGQLSPIVATFVEACASSATLVNAGQGVNF